MNAPIGHRRWAVAEGYIPGWSNGPEPQFTSHETACLLNVSDEDAHVEITVFFSDREPIAPYRLRVPAPRTLHVRFNELEDHEPIPWTPTTRASSSQTSPSWCSTPGSIRARPRTRCSPP